jgi:hypothetical protein
LDEDMVSTFIPQNKAVVLSWTFRYTLKHDWRHSLCNHLNPHCANRHCLAHSTRLIYDTRNQHQRRGLW